MFMQKLVLPIAGRAATMTRSERCRPEVNSSKSVKPVATPVTSSFFSASSSICLNVFLTISETGSKPLRIAPSAISKMVFSASSSTTWVSSTSPKHDWLMRLAAAMRLRSTALSLTIRE